MNLAQAFLSLAIKHYRVKYVTIESDDRTNFTTRSKKQAYFRRRGGKSKINFSAWCLITISAQSNFNSEKALLSLTCDMFYWKRSQLSFLQVRRHVKPVPNKLIKTIIQQRLRQNYLRDRRRAHVWSLVLYTLYYACQDVLYDVRLCRISDTSILVDDETNNCR